MNRQNVLPKHANVRPVNTGFNRRGFLKRAGTTALASATIMVGSGKFALAAKGGTNKNNNDAVYLYPSGDIVDVVLNGLAHTGPETGTSTDPSTANPPSYGFPILDRETFFSDDGEDFVARTYVTSDYVAIQDALTNGGVIILKPGTYNWNMRTVYNKIVGAQEVFDRTSMNFRSWGSALDYHIKGAESDAKGPTAKIVCDQYIHAGSDPTWTNTPTQLIENIHFDNTEYMYERWYNAPYVGWTAFGWFGQADIAMKECKFTGGGVTFHNWGKVVFEGNLMENTLYGVELTSSDSDFLASRNKISTIAGSAILIEANSIPEEGGSGKLVEIVRNEIEWAEFVGIGVYYTNACVVILHNTVTSVPFTYPNEFGYYAGIGCWDCFMGEVLVTGNIVTGGNNLNNYCGINFGGTSSSVIQSNKILGSWLVPVLLDWSHSPANSNVLVGNNLKHATPLYGFHIYLDGASYNVVRGGGAADKNLIVMDYGEGNLITGVDHQIGKFNSEEPYLSMKEAMRNKFAAIKSVGWNQKFEWQQE